MFFLGGKRKISESLSVFPLTYLPFFIYCSTAAKNYGKKLLSKDVTHKPTVHLVSASVAINTDTISEKRTLFELFNLQNFLMARLLRFLIIIY